MFCKTVWNGLHILPDGYIRLCSIGQNTDRTLDMQSCRDKDGNVMHILTHSIQDIMNSDKHREVRLLNVKNPAAWSPHCECCENREIVTKFDQGHPNRSRRIYLMKVEDNIQETSYHDKIDENGNIDWMPSSLDIRFGNLCNQKCVMCSPVYSNLWYDEYREFYGNLKFGQGTKIEVIKNSKTGKWIEPPELEWFNDPRWWPKFDTMMPHLKHIYITGGEPMVAPAHDEMLDRLIAAGYSKDIWLEYDSNCSAINSKIIGRWSHFKKVHIRGSMDATEAGYELIRFGGKWETFKKNVQTLREYQRESNGQITLLSLSACFQMTTMFSMIESEEWCKSIGVPFHIRFLEGPKMHSVSSLSDKSKLELIEFYKKHLDTSEKASMIISHIENHIGPKFGDALEVNRFIKFMDFLDTTRNTDWKNILPEVNRIVQSDKSLPYSSELPDIGGHMQD